jgi:hypothetical protein
MAEDATTIMPEFDFSEDAIHDLAHLARNADKLQSVASFASDLSPLPPGTALSHVSRSAEQQTNIPAGDVERILQTMMNLHRVRKRLQLDVAQFVRHVSPTIAARLSRKYPGEVDAWRNAEAAIAEFLGSISEEHPLTILTKAEHLALSYENLFTDARLLTDIRPVFDSSGTKVIEYLIAHTLLIEYYAEPKRREIALALDASDVVRLKQLCERAETKAATLKKTFEDEKWRSFVVGEQNRS